MAKIISIVEKPIADNVSEEAYFLGIQDNGEGKQALCRMPYDKVCRQLNDLTAEDIQKVKNAALGEVTEAAKNAQNIADDLAKRADDGEFNGKDYVLKQADINEIAEKAATLAGAMQGGTVTYKIPKEDYQTDFGDDPNAQTLCGIQISFGTATINVKQLMEDIEAGIIKDPFDHSLSAEEQEIIKKYVSFDIKPWVPTPRVSWFDIVNTRMFEVSDGSIFSDGQCTMYLNKIWNNDFKVSIHAENSNGETAYNCVKSDAIFSAGGLTTIGFAPIFGYTVDYEEETEIQTLNFVLFALGTPKGYGSTLNEYTSYVTDDDVKEVTITFIPNNAYVEEYDDEESV